MAVKESSFSLKSVALGIVVGITFTAVVVSVASLFAINDVNRKIRFTLDKIRSTVLNSTEVNFVYPHVQTIADFDTTGWKTEEVAELSMTATLPADWQLSEANTACGDSQECLKVTVLDGSEGVKIQLIENDNTDLTGSSAFPAVIKLAGKDTTVQIYREDKCEITLCEPDPEGNIRYVVLDSALAGKNVSMFINPLVDLETAVLLNLLKFN